LKLSKIYPDWDFWFEKKPSGNPGCHAYICTNVQLFRSQNIVVICDIVRMLGAALNFVRQIIFLMSHKHT
jgi:hypothetical protein